MAQDTKCTRCDGTGVEPHHGGMELKRLRMNSRVTQETLAGILGVSQPYISQIENDRVPIPQNIRDEYLAMFGD